MTRLFENIHGIKNNGDLQKKQTEMFEQKGWSNWYTKYSINNSRLKYTKSRIEHMYQDIKHLLDTNFKDKFQRETISRGRELYIGHLLYTEGYTLLTKSDRGPDFCIELTQNKKIRIECVVANPGEQHNKVPPFNSSANINDVQLPRIMRLTNSIQFKIQKFKDYLTQGIVNKDDELYIAVSPNFSDIYDDEIILGATYGKGLNSFHKNQTGQLTGPYFIQRDFILKKGTDNNAHVNTNILLDKNNAFITGVLYSARNIFDNIKHSYPDDCSKSLLLLHNPHATSDCSLNFGIHYQYIRDHHAIHRKTRKG